MIEVGDEKAFVIYAENFIFKMQESLRSKNDMEGEALLAICEKVEDYSFRKVLKECGPVPHECVWMKADAINWYQNICQKILRNLDIWDFNWRKFFDEGKTNLSAFYSILTNDNLQALKKRPGYCLPTNKPKISRATPKAKLISSTNALNPFNPQSQQQPILKVLGTSSGAAKSKAKAIKGSDRAAKARANKTGGFGKSKLPMTSDVIGSASTATFPREDSTMIFNNATTSSSTYNLSSDQNNMHPSGGLEEGDDEFGLFEDLKEEGEDNDNVMNVINNNISVLNESKWNIGGGSSSGMNNSSSSSSSSYPTSSAGTSNTSGGGGGGTWASAQYEMEQQKRREITERQQLDIYEREKIRQREVNMSSILSGSSGNLAQSQTSSAQSQTQQQQQTQRQVEEEREKMRRTLQAQTQTIDLDNAALRDDLAEFMNL